MKRTILGLMAFSVMWTGCSSPDQPHSNSHETSKTELGVSTILARAVESPSDFLEEPVAPRVIAGFNRRIPTNDWWTSLIWPFYPGNNFGENLYAHPLVLKALPNGLALGLPSDATVTPDDVHYTHHFREDLRVGVSDLDAPEILVEDYSDWTVTPRWQSGATWMNATIGHGLLFTYFRTNGTQALVNFPQAPAVFAQLPGALGVEINGQAYGLFAPLGQAWHVNGLQAQAPLNGDYFSVALLPRADVSTLQDFHSRAFSFVTDTKASWSLHNGQVETQFDLQVEALEGPIRDPALALYRHQWLRTQASTEDWFFPSARGQMKGLIARSFSTRAPFTGVLPNLPLGQTTDTNLLGTFLQEVAREGPLLDKDTYVGGKDLGKLAALIPIAEQMGRHDLVELWLDQIQGRLNDYFDGELPYRFTYNDQWDTLLAEPVAFESDKYLNDHHFHYGYLIMGAASLARYRPEWASANQQHVDEMILDVANPDREHARYPFLRHFDPYAGHSWASGAQNFAGGNNQESSSEAVHFASALVLWGEETNQQRWVDLGAYLYSTEVDAIWEYWFDKDEAVFPADFVHPALGILWGGGGAYATWWTANPEEIHGINFLPIHGGSLYLGHHIQALQRNLEHLQTEAGSLLEWRDIIWGAQVFVSPKQTLSNFLAERPVPEGGESRAHTYHWLTALNELGVPRSDITSDAASFAVFENKDGLTYVAYNPSNQPSTVSFSNSHQMDLDAKELAVSKGSDVTAPDPPEDPPVGETLPTTLPTTYELDSAELGQWVGSPHQGAVLRIEGVHAAYQGGKLSFHLPVDAGNNVGTAVQVEVRYDFQGDGQVDKRDVYHYFPTDPVSGPESYTQDRGLLVSDRVYQDLVGGTVELEFWSPIGQGQTQVLQESSSFIWPYQAASTPEPGPDPDPSPLPDPDPPVTPGLQVFRFGASSLGTEALEQAVPGGDGLNHDSQPFRSRSWTALGLTGSCLESDVQFTLPVDSGASVANAVQARLHFDFDGDGQVDRVTTFGYFPTNDVPGFETYLSSGARTESSGAAWRDFQNGSVRIEVWNALGTADAILGEEAQLRLPLE